MARTVFFLLLALIVSIVLSSPINSPKKRSFRVERIKAGNYVPNGPAALKRAYRKYGISNEFSSSKKRSRSTDFSDVQVKPNGAVAVAIEAATNDGSASSTTGTGETAANATQNNAQFVSEVTVGGQKMIVNFDTGSSDAWFFNTELSSVEQGSHRLYNPSQSPSFSLFQGASFDVHYGDSSFATGLVGFDTLEIGGVTAQKQAVGIPTQVSAEFIQDTATDGLIGLAFNKLNTVGIGFNPVTQSPFPVPQNTFFANIVSDLSLPVFTALLKGDGTGFFEFGEIDSSAHTGQLTSVPVNTANGFWQFQSGLAEVNGEKAQLNDENPIADTGTSLMLVSDDMLNLYWRQVDGSHFDPDQEAWVFPCNATLPDLSVAVGDSYMATVPGANFNFAPTESTQFCFGGLQSRGNTNTSVYGDVWLRSQFVVFSADGPSLQVAPQS